MDENTVQSNPTLRLMLETARAWGVSPSVFTGRELTQVTEHTYDLSGRVIRSTTRLESAWTDEDRELAVELQDYERSLCPGCRAPMSETTDPANEMRYRAELPIRCHRCTTSAKAMTHYEESEVPSALFLPIVLRGESDEADLPA